MVTTVVEATPTATFTFPVNGLHVITEDDEAYLKHLITEDDEPVDNLFSEKQQRLLTEPLYSSWAGPGNNRPYLASANVGVFTSPRERPLVPDVFLSLDVQADTNWWTTGRSYFIWKYGKSPDLVIEIVSNTKGKETLQKMQDYNRMGVQYYIVFDPSLEILDKHLQLYERHGSGYVEMTTSWFEPVQLGLTLWTGRYEQCDSVWLRWCDRDGQVIATGAERLEQERLRAEKLLAQLRALGIEPEL